MNKMKLMLRLPQMIKLRLIQSNLHLIEGLCCKDSQLNLFQTLRTMCWQPTSIQISLNNHQYQTLINSNISQLHLWKLMWLQVVGYLRCLRAVLSQMNSRGLSRRTKRKGRNRMTISPMMRARLMGFSGAPSVDSHLTCLADLSPIIMICTVHF
jgi:hypothetical protein